jgi:diguanylate cyclase (GGDEF)-like protein/hemerythrin-like metal-binding protein/PAS domain S-box-containing protein
MRTRAAVCTRVPNPNDTEADLRSLGFLASSRVIAVAAVRQERIIFANHAFEVLFHAGESLAGIPLHDLVSDTFGDSLAVSLASAERAPVTYLGSGKRPDGRTFALEIALEQLEIDSKPTLIAFAWDITKRYRSTEQLNYLAYADSLTGVANRARFTDVLHNAVLPSRRLGSVAVLMLDLDGFKAVNDEYGHEAGDTLLQIAAQRLQGCVRAGDTVARLGGDEFAAILPELNTDDVAALVALRMLAAFDAPANLGKEKVTIAVSIGIAVLPTHASTADALVVAADTALYSAKRAGKNRYSWATEQLVTESLRVEPPIWNSVHLVGIGIIDDQHAHLASLIDTLSSMLRDGETHSALHSQLDEIIGFAKVHFATEEEMMIAEQVDSLIPHREAHQRLLEDLEKLDMPDDKASISLILRYVREWLLRHVDGCDRQLAVALLAKGRH